MKRGLFSLNLIMGGIILFMGVAGYNLHRQRPGLPASVNPADVIGINGTAIEDEGDIGFVLNHKVIGETAVVVIEKDGKRESKLIRLVAHYSQAPVPLLYLFIGLFSMATGFVVYILRSRSRKARVYYWATLAFGYCIIVASGYYLGTQNVVSYILGAAFFFLYPLAAALLMHFSFQYPYKRWKVSRVFLFLIIYLPALCFAAALIFSYLLSNRMFSIEIYRYYLVNLSVFRIYLIFYVSYAVGQLIRAFIVTFMEELRAQIKWALYGLAVGLFPFILLYQLPIVLGFDPLISEELSNIFFLFVPVAFSISVLKYKLMDINFIINRSMVYSFLTILIVGIYLFSSNIFQRFLIRWFSINDVTVSVLAAMVTAASFHPLRRRVQLFVDKSFFQTSYDYRQTIHSFIQRAQMMVNPDQLLNFYLDKINRSLPVEKTEIVVCSEKSGKRSILFKRNGHVDPAPLLELLDGKGFFLARKSAVTGEKNLDFSAEEFLEKTEMEMIIPLLFRLSDLRGFIIQGRKKSGERYNSEDIALLQTMSRELALNLERIRLQEEVIYEKAEKEKLQDLNRLKTEFISSVSHEMRTPLTSIQGLSELLLEKKVRGKARQDELLGVMAGECTRLSRLLHNILDFGKIERKSKLYHFKETGLLSVAYKAIKLHEHRLKSSGFRLETDFPDKEIRLKIDEDAVIQVLTNLLDNALKYSSEEKVIKISVVQGKDWVKIHIEDKGIGIPEKEKARIFKSFFRLPEAARMSPGGVGLGLKITRHIMDAHHGKIDVRSEPGKGSTFTLTFPNN
jgi:signal transduction histidine kinase